MISTIQPREPFPISRQLEDPSDAGTYYVQSVVRLISTNAIIAIVNLSPVGSQIYTGLWTPLADPSGRGSYVSINTRVYTDAGHTMLSDNYAQTQEVYFVYDKYNFVQILGQQIAALTSEDVDYKKIKKIVDDANEKQNKQINTALHSLADDVAGRFPEVPDLEKIMANVTGAMGNLKNRIGEIKMPEVKLTDLSPVLSAIAAIKMPEFPEIPKLPDFTPIFEAASKENHYERLAEIIEEMRKFIEMIPEVAEKFKTLQQGVQGLEQQVKDMTYAAAKQKPAPVAEKPKNPRLNRHGQVSTRAQPS